MNLKFIHDTERQQIFKESLFNWFQFFTFEIGIHIKTISISAVGGLH